MSNYEQLWQYVGELAPYTLIARESNCMFLPEALRAAAVQCFLDGVDPENDIRAKGVKEALVALQNTGSIP